MHLFQTEARGGEVNVQYCHYFDSRRLFAIICVLNLYMLCSFLLQIIILFFGL